MMSVALCGSAQLLLSLASFSVSLAVSFASMCEQRFSMTMYSLFASESSASVLKFTSCVLVLVAYFTKAPFVNPPS